MGKQWSGEGLGGKTGTDRSLQFGPVCWVALSWALACLCGVAITCSQCLQRHAGWQLLRTDWSHLALGDLNV